MATQTNRKRRDGRTQTARAERARKELLAAALELFAERGYDGSSVDEVAQRAGYSKGAVYWHFSSKDDLFFALLDEAVDQPWRQAIAALETAGADEDMAPEASRRFIDMLRSRRQLLLVEHEYLSRALRDPKLRRRYASRQRAMRTALAKAVSARLTRLGAPLPPDGGARLANMMVALTAGLAQAKLVDPAAVPDDLLGEAFALLYAGQAAEARD